MTICKTLKSTVMMISDRFVTDLMFLKTRVIGRRWKETLVSSQRDSRESDRVMKIRSTTFSQDSRWASKRFTNKHIFHIIFICGQEVESNIEKNNCQIIIEVNRLDKDIFDLRKSLDDMGENTTTTLEETRTGLLEATSQSCQSVRDYCQENIIDINNNIVDFKDDMREANGKINKKILGCGKNLEICRS